MLTPVERAGNVVRMIDQRKLPLVETWLDLETPEEVAGAITDMVVRGAPAIGISAAFGVALGATQAAADPGVDLEGRLEQIYAFMSEARPTAVNLRWAVERMRRVAARGRDDGLDDTALARRLEQEAAQIHREDLAACKAMGRHGAQLVPQEATILTHCNAGGLATAGYGTALGVVRGAVEAGKRIRVLADETRPFLQGSRLTAWELMRDDIDTTLITDNMAGALATGGYGTALGVVRGAVAAGKKIRVLADETRPFLQGSRLTAWELMQDDIDTTLITDSMAGALMRAGEVDLVVVGSDRIAANGDIANKIGTYTVAVLARENRIPFYVAAPLSTIDYECPDGSRIPIEERDIREVTELFGQRVAPEGVKVRNPAFDVTPAVYVTAIITECGIARPPYSASLLELRRVAEARDGGSS
jgi:methylthioribose-1-phosphate isomerase